MSKPKLTIRKKRILHAQWQDFHLRLEYHYKYSSQCFWDGTRLRPGQTHDAVFLTVLRGPHSHLPIRTGPWAPLRLPTKATRVNGGPVAAVIGRLNVAASDKA